MKVYIIYLFIMFREQPVKKTGNSRESASAESRMSDLEKKATARRYLDAVSRDLTPEFLAIVGDDLLGVHSVRMFKKDGMDFKENTYSISGTIGGEKVTVTSVDEDIIGSRSRTDYTYSGSIGGSEIKDPEIARNVYLRLVDVLAFRKGEGKRKEQEALDRSFAIKSAQRKEKTEAEKAIDDLRKKLGEPDLPDWAKAA